jgi:hypothetical protein
MHLVIIAWLYVILMVSVTYWPDIYAMTWRFLLLGILPAWLLLKFVLFVRKRPDDQSISESPSGHTPPVADKSKNADPR